MRGFLGLVAIAMLAIPAYAFDGTPVDPTGYPKTTDRLSLPDATIDMDSNHVVVTDPILLDLEPQIVVLGCRLDPIAEMFIIAFAPHPVDTQMTSQLLRRVVEYREKFLAKAQQVAAR